MLWKVNANGVAWGRQAWPILCLARAGLLKALVMVTTPMARLWDLPPVLVHSCGWLIESPRGLSI